MLLEGKAAIVTGAATGIGRAIARAYAREGALVTINHLKRQDMADSLHDEIIQLGGNALVFEADVTSEDEILQMVNATKERFGSVDILVNCAGIQKFESLLSMELSTWNKIIETNLTACFLLIKACVPHMQEHGSGCVVNISSVHEDLAAGGNTAYCVSKSGLKMLMKCSAEEFARFGIRVNNIAPGATATEMTAHVQRSPEQLNGLNSRIPLGRIGQPEDIAELAVYLASPQAGYITGSTFMVDGGLHLKGW